MDHSGIILGYSNSGKIVGFQKQLYTFFQRGIWPQERIINNPRWSEQLGHIDWGWLWLTNGLFGTSQSSKSFKSPFGWFPELGDDENRQYLEYLEYLDVYHEESYRNPILNFLNTNWTIEHCSVGKAMVANYEIGINEGTTVTTGSSGIWLVVWNIRFSISWGSLS